MQYIYFLNQNFVANFMRMFSPTNFSNPPTQNFENWFSLKCVGKNFFRFQIRKLRKNPRRMIPIDIRFILRTPTQNEFSIFEGLWRLRMMKVFLKGLKLWPSCSEGSITQKSPKLSVFGHALCRKVIFLSQKMKTPSSF